jgi:hypothetical protein
MIYLIGGAPRAGKSILCQQVSSRLKIGWISTDLIMELLRLKDEEGIKKEWNASLEAITADAEWFFPYLERFIWGISSMAEDYAIEGVDFLPAQIAPLSTKYVIRAVFLGHSSITLDVFDQFPGRSPGYSYLPEEMRRRIVQDIPLWSEFIRREAERSGVPYVDMAGDFPRGLHEAEVLLTSSN